jgi:hypothetical protein
VPAAPSRASASSRVSSSYGTTQRRCALSPIRHQYAAPTSAASRTVGTTAAFARSIDALTSGSSEVEPSSQNPKSRCTVGSISASGSTRSCSRGPGPGSPVVETIVPGSAASACSSTCARSRLTSPERACTCRPSSTRPSARTIAGSASGSSVASVTSRSESRTASGAVADGTSSRSATQSHSLGNPANGRATGTSPAPWQLLYRRPDPHGHGAFGSVSPSGTDRARRVAVRRLTPRTLASRAVRIGAARPDDPEEAR